MESFRVQIFNEEGKNVSPKPLKHSIYDKMSSSLIQSKLELTLEENIRQFQSKIHGGGVLDRTTTLQIPIQSIVKRTTRKKAPVKVVIQTGEEKPIPESGEMKLRLSETKTMWLFSTETIYSQDQQAKLENEAYLDLKIGPGKNRNRSTAETQTCHFTEKAKSTITTEIKVTDNFVNASAWDLYDTFQGADGDTGGLSIKEFQMLLDTSLKSKAIPQRRTGESDITKLPANLQSKQLFALPEFHYATLVTERLLAANTFQKEQALFKIYMKSKYDDFKPSLFTYELRELWQFNRELEFELGVSSLDWNPFNSDLLAVGYGNFTFGAGDVGCVCVWSAKNPKHPERKYSFDEAVTSLSYSVSKPNIIAVGCCSGVVYIVDVSNETGNVRILAKNRIHTRHGPVWKLQWFMYKDVIGDREELLAAGQGGIVIKFTFPNDEETCEIIKLEYISSVPKSPDKRRPDQSSAQGCETMVLSQIANTRSKKQIRMTCENRSLSALSFSLLADKHLCYISTKEGVISKCVLRNPYHCKESFPAHHGLLYGIEHSPFTRAFFITCGSDWFIKIWLEGLLEPVLTLQSTKLPVVSVKWSPTHSTIFASISGAQIAIWDISRKHHAPIRVLTFEESKNLTSILFSKHGTNLVIGDQNGLVRVLNLSELPHQSFLQVEALTKSIETALQTKEELLVKFNKARNLLRQDLKSKIMATQQENM